MAESREQLRAEWREAIWKWRWLGFRRSTPGFKFALGLLAVAAVWIGVTYVRL